MICFEMLAGGALSLGLLYIALSPRFATSLYRSFLFYPADYPKGKYDLDNLEGIAPENIFFTAADGTKLHGWFFRQTQAAKTILFHHGNAANLTSRLGLIQLQLRAGASVFIYDYRGFGRSEGKPDIHGICADGCAAFDYLVNQSGIPTCEIINYGESLGAAVACQVSVVRMSGGLILQSSFSSLQRIGKEVLPWLLIYPPSLFPLPAMDNISIVRGAHPPLLILHGSKDTVILCRHSRELSSQASPPYTFVELPEANHNDLPIVEPERYLIALQQFLLSLESQMKCPTYPGDSSHCVL